MYSGIPEPYLILVPVGLNGPQTIIAYSAYYQHLYGYPVCQVPDSVKVVFLTSVFVLCLILSLFSQSSVFFLVFCLLSWWQSFVLCLSLSLFSFVLVFIICFRLFSLSFQIAIVFSLASQSFVFYLSLSLLSFVFCFLSFVFCLNLRLLSQSFLVLFSVFCHLSSSFFVVFLFCHSLSRFSYVCLCVLSQYQSFVIVLVICLSL